MQSKVKLTKRQVKEDKFTTFMLTTKDQVSENWQFYVIGLVAIVLLVSAVFWYFNNQATQSAEAGTKFANAMLEYQAGNNQVAMLSLGQIADDYGGTKVAENATYTLASLYLSSRNYADAINYYEQYLSRYKDNRLHRAASYAGIATALEGQGDFAGAAETFIEAVDEYPDGPLAADYEYGAVRNYIEAGDMNAAETRLNNLKENFGGTGSAKAAIRLFSEKSRS